MTGLLQNSNKGTVMSKLEELIQRYCPDGVERKPLGEVCNIKGRIGFRGYTRNDQVKEGEGALSLSPSNIQEGQMDYSKGTYITWAKYEESPEIKTYNGDIILCKTASVGKVALVKDLPYKATINPQLVVLKDIKCNASFLTYVLGTDDIQRKIISMAGVGSVPNIPQKALAEIEIPIPPLPVQEEIVRVLDTFTELQAELQAELQKRLQQYNYYRDNLLSDFTPEQEPREYTLEEITTDIYSGATPSKEKRDYWENGTIPWMSSGEVNLGQVYEVEGRITQLGYDKCSTRMVPEGSVVIALAGQGKTRGTVAILRTSVCTNQSLAALVPNPAIVSGEYLYYYLKTQYSKLREVSSGDGTRGGLNLKMLRSYKVLVPSLKTQAQIVSILDRFETLTNDLTAGLPAEIEKRRQQYEYYRDKLLTFKRKEA